MSQIAQPPKVHRLNHQPTLEEAQKLVGGYIEIIYSADRSRQLVINEEGKLRGLPVNVEAMAIWGFTFDVLVGDVVVLEREHWMT